MTRSKAEPKGFRRTARSDEASQTGLDAKCSIFQCKGFIGDNVAPGAVN